jgi:hypothetical protein
VQRGKVAAVLGVASIVWASVAVPAVAGPVPFTDPGAIGKITLCDSELHVMTHGSIYTKPFAWRAVGSTPGASDYQGNGQESTLFADTPIQGSQPPFWTPWQMTTAAKYTSSSRPMAGATPIDPSLNDFLGFYQPKWDGMVQLRMFLSAPSQSTDTQEYNAAVIRVTGTTWTLLDGGTDGCTSGTAKSNELERPYVASLPTPPTDATTANAVAPKSHSASGTPSVRASAPSSAAANNGSTAHTPGDSVSATSASANHASSGSSLSWLVVVLVILIATFGAVVFYLRRRRSSARQI